VKIQVEFNPAVVAEYRLIGYENRMLAREDFNNDAVDAGDIGAGHTVTALYEVALAGSGGEKIDALRYGTNATVAAKGDEIAHLKLRYKRPEDGTSAASRLIERNILRRDVQTDLAKATPAYRMAASVAAFGQLLTGGRYTGTFDYTAVEQLAAGAGDDRFGERSEFRQLVRVAKSLSNPVGLVEKGVEIGG
jgi:Ca-activated chloride channel homolog